MTATVHLVTSDELACIRHPQTCDECGRSFGYGSPGFECCREHRETVDAVRDAQLAHHAACDTLNRTARLATAAVFAACRMTDSTAGWTGSTRREKRLAVLMAQGRLLAVEQALNAARTTRLQLTGAWIDHGSYQLGGR